MTAGSAEQISRIVGDVGFPHETVDQLEPRLSKAMAWTAEYVPAEDRTTVRAEPDRVRLASLTQRESTWLTLFLDHLGDAADLDGGDRAGLRRPQARATDCPSTTRRPTR